MTPAAVQLPIEGELPSLGNATAWLNSQPLTAAGLCGKVVLIDFWTYTCINWLRSLPYVRAWAEKYKDHEVVVIGVHSPEFAFEKDIDNGMMAANIQEKVVVISGAKRCAFSARPVGPDACRSPAWRWWFL